MLTYTDGAGTWQSVELTQGIDNRWEVAVSVPRSVEYLLQAVDNNGNTSLIAGRDIASSTTTASLATMPGWNLMALPITPLASYTAQAVLDQINAQGGNCTEVNRWLNGGSGRAHQRTALQ